MNAIHHNSAAPPGKWEMRTIVFCFAIYLLFQINAAFHHGSFGGDFQSHRDLMTYAATDLWRTFTVLMPYQTDPPMMYMIGGAIHRLSRGIHYFELIALFYIALNTFALLLLYRLLCSLLKQPLVRISAMIFILFLPVFMIHAEVYAGDGLTLAPFILSVYSLFRIYRAPVEGEFWRFVILLAASLTLGLVAKFTFEAQVAACLTALTLFGWTKVHDWRRLITAMVVIAVPCAITAGFYISRLRITHVNTMHLFEYGSEFTLKDLFLPHAADKHILTAPPYNEITPGSPNPHDANLLAKGRFSYPALLQLGIFTDLANIYQYDPTDSYFGTRSLINHRRMRRAMRSSGIFFFGFLILAPLSMSRYLYRSLAKRDSSTAFLAGWSIQGIAWFLNILAFLPIVPAYIGGYWDPRLIMPALLTFIVISMTAVDRFAATHSRIWSLALLLLVCYQSAVHLSFLWPWGVMRSYLELGPVMP